MVTGSKDCTVMVWMFSAKSQAILGDNNSKFHANFSPPGFTVFVRFNMKFYTVFVSFGMKDQYVIS